MKIRIDLKIIIFLIIFYFTNQIRIYLILMVFCFIHEIGHILTGLILKIKPEKLEIMPFGLSVTFYTKNYNKMEIKEIFIAIAGPIVSLILAIIGKYIKLSFITTNEIIYSNILIFIFNMIPIYPLDGGRIINGILHIQLENEKANILIERISKITLIVLTIISSVALYYYKNIAIFLICLFLWIKTLAIF